MSDIAAIFEEVSKVAQEVVTAGFKQTEPHPTFEP